MKRDEEKVVFRPESTKSQKENFVCLSGPKTNDVTFFLQGVRWNAKIFDPLSHLLTPFPSRGSTKNISFPGENCEGIWVIHSIYMWLV